MPLDAARKRSSTRFRAFFMMSLPLTTPPGTASGGLVRESEHGDAESQPSASALPTPEASGPGPGDAAGARAPKRIALALRELHRFPHHRSRLDRGGDAGRGGGGARQQSQLPERLGYRARIAVADESGRAVGADERQEVAHAHVPGAPSWSVRVLSA